jgi:hypothetical protein
MSLYALPRPRARAGASGIPPAAPRHEGGAAGAGRRVPVRHAHRGNVHQLAGTWFDELPDDVQTLIAEFETEPDELPVYDTKTLSACARFDPWTSPPACVLVGNSIDGAVPAYFVSLQPPPLGRGHEAMRCVLVLEGSLPAWLAPLCAETRATKPKLSRLAEFDGAARWKMVLPQGQGRLWQDPWRHYRLPPPVAFGAAQAPRYFLNFSYRPILWRRSYNDIAVEDEKSAYGSTTAFADDIPVQPLPTRAALTAFATTPWAPHGATRPVEGQSLWVWNGRLDKVSVRSGDPVAIDLSPALHELLECGVLKDEQCGLGYWVACDASPVGSKCLAVRPGSPPQLLMRYGDCKAFARPKGVRRAWDEASG